MGCNNPKVCHIIVLIKTCNKIKRQLFLSGMASTVENISLLNFDHFQH